MKQTVMELNWEGGGYHGFPGAMGPGGYTSAEEVVAWKGFEQVLASAKNGDFSGAERLLDIYDDAGWLLSGACAELLGDIGSRALFERIRPVVTAILDPMYSVDLGCSLAIGGHLSSVPALLETLGKIAEFEDAPALIQMLSVMLEPEPGPLGDIDRLDDIDTYADDVRLQADALAARLGTTDAVVMFGDLFSIDKLVAATRRSLTNNGLFNTYLRHKLEATTGFDFSGFYENGSLRPLRALAVIEDFEDTGKLARYQPGRRYFFGHPVPD